MRGVGGYARGGWVVGCARGGGIGIGVVLGGDGGGGGGG